MDAASELYKSYETDFLLAQSEIQQKLDSIASLDKGMLKLTER